MLSPEKILDLKVNQQVADVNLKVGSGAYQQAKLQLSSEFQAALKAALASNEADDIKAYEALEVQVEQWNEDFPTDKITLPEVEPA